MKRIGRALGLTIVEPLIVIVVIGSVATTIIVLYNGVGVQNRAHIATVQADPSNAVNGQVI